MKTDPVETTRLLLREITENDAAQIVAWRGDPAIYRFFTIPKELTVEEHLRWYHTGYLSNPERIDFVARRREDDVPVGLYGIKRSGDEAEISYLTDRRFCRNGYAAEAVYALLQWCGKEWNCSTALAVIHRENADSIRFARRMGFRLVSSQSNFITMKRPL